MGIHQLSRRLSLTDTIYQMLDELTSLAALASSRGGVKLRTGEPGCLWSFNWATQTITVNPTDLALRPPDYCRGLILHESAHAALTRVAEVIPRELYQADLHPLLNVIEDCRIENWLQDRLPGCRPWIRLYNDRYCGSPSAATRRHAASDPAGGFLVGLLDHWWNETPLLTLHPETVAALEETRRHFDRAIAAYPNPHAPNAADTRNLYACHPVSLCFRSQDYDQEPSPEECIIRMLQHRMWSITWQHIVPVYRRLLKHPDSKPPRQHVIGLAGKAAGPHASPAHGFNRSAGAATQPMRSGDPHEYGRAVTRHASLIESCAAAMIRELAAESRPRRTRFHRSGDALDLRVAMQFEADPRQYGRLWQRTTRPRHPEPAFVVLVDSSSSMAGERAEATFAGLVVLREVCLRLDIPLSIISFSMNAQLHQSWDNPQVGGIQAELAGLLHPRGGTDISPALDRAAGLLDLTTRRHRHLWILSDGNTRNPEAARGKIRAIRRGGCLVHGLGLGPDSGQIATLIPRSPINLAPHQLPEVFTRLLRFHATHRQV